MGQVDGSFTATGGLGIVLEQAAAGLIPVGVAPGQNTFGNTVLARLSQYASRSDLRQKTFIEIVPYPQQRAIDLIRERLGCSPLAAQMCFAELLVKIGVLADDNGRLAREHYRGLSISDTEAAIAGVLAAVDVAAIEGALKEGICEPVDFLTPLEDPTFYMGVDVEPGHIAAGLVAERPSNRVAVMAGIEDRRAALIVGPSGAGKSALMWEVANSLRHTVRWFRIHRLTSADLPALLQFVHTFRSSAASPVGFVIDDVGRSSPEGWSMLSRRVASLAGVVLLGSIREEDIVLIGERARSFELHLEADDDLAERLWSELVATDKTEWAGWREPWRLSGGLLLEYVHILTRGRRMADLLSDQVAARINDPARALELDILRCGAWAGTANAELDAARLAGVLQASDADLSRALQRLVQEHLIRSPGPGKLAGLHQLRSQELLRLTHQTVLPSLETSFERTVLSVAAGDLEYLVADVLSARRLSTEAVLPVLTTRLERESQGHTLAAALRGLAAGRVAAGVDEWLARAEVRSLARTQVSSVAFFGAGGVDISALAPLRFVQTAADSLARIKGTAEHDPRRLLVEGIAPSTLSLMIATAALSDFDEILAALVGLPLHATVRACLNQARTELLDADLDLAASIMGTLAALDRQIAVNWTNALGQQAFFDRIQAETAWAGPVSTEQESDGTIVRCDILYVAASVQDNPHDAVVSLCERILAFCPAADIAASNAVTGSGDLAGLFDMPLAQKRIPRENLPPPSLPRWNRKWIDLISRRMAAPSYSDYLSRGASLLERLLPALETSIDRLLRGDRIKQSSIDFLEALNVEAEALTAPDISPSAASGSGSLSTTMGVSRFQNVLHGATGNVLSRFAKLPDGAGAYIAWLGDLIADIDWALEGEPWELIGPPAPALARLRTLMERLRTLAGEAHERQERPAATWAAQSNRARAGNALKFISLAADASGQDRLNERKAKIERCAGEAGINAIFHFLTDTSAILPWPPVKVVALLPASSVPNALTAIAESQPLLRSLLESEHLTIIPLINDVAFPVLASSGHQTLLPDPANARVLAGELGLPHAPSFASGLFGEALNSASELAAMDEAGFGLEARPAQEVKARRDLEAKLSKQNVN